MANRLVQVRRGSNGLRNLSTVDVFGDGPGAENTVFCGGFNALELYVNLQRVSATTAFILKLFWSTDGMNFYQKYFYTDGASPAPSAQTFTLPNTDFSAVFEVPVHGPFCRIGINTQNDGNASTAILAIQAHPRLR